MRSERVLRFQKPRAMAPASQVQPEIPDAKDRGPLISPEQAALRFPAEGRPTPDYLRRRVSPRVKIGRLVLFYEQDFLDWIQKHLETA